MADFRSQNEPLRVWVLKAVRDNDRALQTIDSYEDKFDEHYNYDTKVANHKQLSLGDLAIVIDKKRILGFARIERIESSTSEKVISKCPICGSSTIDVRKTLYPKYRCNNGHAFGEPSKITTPITKFTAVFGETFIPVPTGLDMLSKLRPYYTNGYNQNMSIQLVGEAAVAQFPDIHQALTTYPNFSRLSPYEGLNQQPQNFHPNNLDERDSILQIIKARRGQQRFREAVRRYYGDLCVISGCKILAILEAAHIAPYRGVKDNHETNGLLLRADLHTLFDLNLIGIEPNNLGVHVHPGIKNEYFMINGIQLLCTPENRPSVASLAIRWNAFLKECAEYQDS